MEEGLLLLPREMARMVSATASSSREGSKMVLGPMRIVRRVMGGRTGGVDGCGVSVEVVVEEEWGRG